MSCAFMLPRRVRALIVPMIATATAALVVVPAADAFRKPTKQERSAITRAWKKKHRKKVKKLYLQQIRVSTKNPRYATVLYDNKAPKGFGASHFGNTKLEYFKRRSSGSSAAGFRIAGFFDKFDFSKTENVPPSVQDDADPVYRITYSTIQNERITRTYSWDCAGPHPAQTQSKGDYSWSVSFSNVHLSIPDFRTNQSAGPYSFKGTETHNDPCGHTGGDPGCSYRTFNYSGGGLSEAFRTSSFVYAGYIQLVAGHFATNACGLAHAGASPIAWVEVPLHRDWFSGPIVNETDYVDGSDFPHDAKLGRLGNCEAGGLDNTCDETLDQFQAQVKFERVHRR